jgi:hypothetical protein
MEVLSRQISWLIFKACEKSSPFSIAENTNHRGIWWGSIGTRVLCTKERRNYVLCIISMRTSMAVVEIRRKILRLYIPIIFFIFL